MRFAGAKNRNACQNQVQEMWDVANNIIGIKTSRMKEEEAIYNFVPTCTFNQEMQTTYKCNG